MTNGQRTRTRRAGGQRRDGVLDHAISVISTRGYAATRFSDVSAASGVAVSTLQGYFGSREDMLIEAMQRATTLVVAEMDAFVARFDDPWQQLVAMVDRGLLTPAATWRMLMEFWTAAAHDAELRDLAGDLARQYRAPFIDAVHRGVARGEFTPRFAPQVVVETVVSAVVGLLYPVVLGHPVALPADYRAAVLAQLAFSLGIRPEHPGSPTTSTRER